MEERRKIIEKAICYFRNHKKQNALPPAFKVASNFAEFATKEDKPQEVNTLETYAKKHSIDWYGGEGLHLNAPEYKALHAIFEIFQEQELALQDYSEEQQRELYKKIAGNDYSECFVVLIEKNDFAKRIYSGAKGGFERKSVDFILAKLSQIIMLTFGTDGNPRMVNPIRVDLPIFDNYSIVFLNKEIFSVGNNFILFPRIFVPKMQKSKPLEYNLFYVLALEMKHHYKSPCFEYRISYNTLKRKIARNKRYQRVTNIKNDFNEAIANLIDYNMIQKYKEETLPDGNKICVFTINRENYTKMIAAHA